jgi:predicted sulfurtransferase
MKERGNLSSELYILGVSCIPEVHRVLSQLLSRLRRSRVPEITPAELQAALSSAQPPVLIDIRDAAQFAAGHLPGALLIPLDRLKEEAAWLSRAQATTVVY